MQQSVRAYRGQGPLVRHLLFHRPQLGHRPLHRQAHRGTLAATHQYAELFRLEQVSGANLLVDGVILGTYSTTPLVEEITAVQDVRLEDLTIVAPSGGYA